MSLELWIGISIIVFLVIVGIFAAIVERPQPRERTYNNKFKGHPAKKNLDDMHSLDYYS